MKKILAIVILSSTTIYALGGINETTIEGGTIDNKSGAKYRGEAQNTGTVSGAGNVAVGVGMVNTQAGNASIIKVKNVNVKNSGDVQLKAINKGMVSGAGNVRVGAGMVNIQ